MPDEVHYETYLLWYEEARWVLHGSGALPILELAYHQWYATLEKTDPPAARAILDAWEERNRARQTSHEAGVRLAQRRFDGQTSHVTFCTSSIMPPRNEHKSQNLVY